MNEASNSVAQGKLPSKLRPVIPPNVVPNELKSVAQAFVDLQQARHEADYNLAKNFTRSEVDGLVSQATQAFQDWKNVRKEDSARIYLSSFLIGSKRGTLN